ncbi:MAG: hypothetical protein A2X08_13630 [Bacteroidetes bacterium GWA2_32_17]|nr:MAG: hypothetical protein A2X08_13630 [Bacteroidetes bacterium GWA2_32_17]
MKKLRFEENPTIFTTGAFLKPMKITVREGKDIWIWYVSEFIDDSFKEGEVYNPKETSRSLEMLVEEI